ncbi:MAG TPA: YebC/PmpR family DNA-binding transcriptional regulator [Coxiellaceae bacterium]|nr:YebC/PmpR family DNA-binding transcriptional regulator [Coxiellaceae bacterium]
MAGHSKWANIKHKKAKVDAQRGKIFTKLIREITVAARKGGADPTTNSWLRLAIDKARIQNMKGDTIEKAIQRGAGAGDADNMMEVTYEGYGPGGVAVLVECVTDNKNRTVAEVRHAFSKAGGNLGTDGSVAYLFTKQGLIHFEKGVNEDSLMEAAIEAGADDVAPQDDGSMDVMTQPPMLMDIKDALEAKGLKAEHAQVIMAATIEVRLDDPQKAEQMIRLNELLEELDDVQNVHSNANIPDEVLEKL